MSPHSVFISWDLVVITIKCVLFSSNPHSFESLLGTRNLLHFLQNEETLQAPRPDQMSPFSYRYRERSHHMGFPTGSQPCPSLVSPQPASPNSARKTCLFTILLHFWLYSFFKRKSNKFNLGFLMGCFLFLLFKAQSMPITTWEGHQRYNRMNDTFLLV